MDTFPDICQEPSSHILYIINDQACLFPQTFVIITHQLQQTSTKAACDRSIQFFCIAVGSSGGRVTYIRMSVLVRLLVVLHAAACVSVSSTYMPPPLTSGGEIHKFNIQVKAINAQLVALNHAITQMGHVIQLTRERQLLPRATTNLERLYVLIQYARTSWREFQLDVATLTQDLDQPRMSSAEALRIRLYLPIVEFRGQRVVSQFERLLPQVQEEYMAHRMPVIPENNVLDMN